LDEICLIKNPTLTVQIFKKIISSTLCAM